MTLKKKVGFKWVLWALNFVSKDPNTVKLVVVKPTWQPCAIMPYLWYI